MASRQHRETIEIPAGRGTIYDRTGEPLAIGEQATTVYADPRNVVDPTQGGRQGRQGARARPRRALPGLRDRDQAVRLRRSARPTRSKAEALEQLRLAGLGFYPEERRTYPQGTVAAHVLGFAGTDNRGLDGLERSLDRTLAGPPGYEIVVRDPFGPRDRRRHVAARSGRAATSSLTLDHQIQANAEQILAAACARWRAKGATAIVMDPRTGAILAMANAPTFDANRFSARRPPRRGATAPSPTSTSPARRSRS